MRRSHARELHPPPPVTHLAPDPARSITMVTPEVNEVAKARLRAAGSHVVPVHLITPNWKISFGYWETVFTKLQIFSLGNTSAGRVDQVRARVTHMIAPVIASLAVIASLWHALTPALSHPCVCRWPLWTSTPSSSARGPTLSSTRATPPR